jgi:hypothetical protein
MTADNNRKGLDEMEDGTDKTVELGIELRAPNDDCQPPLGQKRMRKREFGFIPIPKSKRLDPNLKVHEQFVFDWKINLIMAGAAVCFLAMMIVLTTRRYLYPTFIIPRSVFPIPKLEIHVLMASLCL